MAAVHPLLLLLTTLAPSWNDSTDFEGVLAPCAPFLREEGERGACPRHEHFEACGDICVESCVRYECPLKCCVEGCFCDEGHVRGPDGTCVPDCETPFHQTNRIDGPTTRECEPDEYISCDSHCQRNCSNYHDVIICDRACVLDCVCKPPKIRGPLGNCISPRFCSNAPQESKSDDWLICNYIRMMNPEDPRCSKTAMPCNDPFGCLDDDSPLQDETVNRIRQRNGIAPCFPSAFVKGPATCRANEHYEECGALCLETCFEYECPLQCCVEGCFCDEGFVRDPSRHTCIPKEHCDSRLYYGRRKGVRCGSDEIPSCDSGCERTCDNYRDEGRKCPDECRMGCVCLPPRVRGPDGTCVLPEDCPTTREAMLEEHMKMAAMICNFVRITGNPPAWSDSCPMIVHDCTDDECLGALLLGQISICRPNEYLNVVPSCPVTCDTYRKGCKVTDRVVPRCDCSEGLVRDSDGGCVPPENCPRHEAAVVCPANEYYDPCLGHCQRDCDNKDNRNLTCPKCVPGCVCVPPMVRGPECRCIPPDGCPAK